MRTTISVSDRLYADVRELKAGRSFSEFAGEAIRRHVDELWRARTADEMAEGYRAEAVHSSLDPAWAAIESEDL